MPTVYVTAPRDAAADLARDLVEHRLAACVNRVHCDSTYRWRGEIHEDEEAILLAKTTEEGVDDLVAHVERVHPYDVPCVETFREEDALPAFAEWVAESVD